MLEFQNSGDYMRAAIVTGAGSGIGRAVAVRLIREGYCLGLMGRRREALEETSGMANALIDPIVLPADVSSPNEIERAFSFFLSRSDRVDLLFNNAGVNRAGAINELSDEEWNEVVSTNLSGAFHVARAAFRAMMRQVPQGGRIINNGSIAAHVPRPRSVAYTATKHAMTGLTRSISLDGRPYSIACGQIDIGNAETSMANRAMRGALQADGTVRTEPTISPDLVADAVVMMANLPLSANVQFLTIMATTMPYIGRG
jgi:NADP-dependent 3-hydroxy acid dehydrogenase YdfG